MINQFMGSNCLVSCGTSSSGAFNHRNPVIERSSNTRRLIHRSPMEFIFILRPRVCNGPKVANSPSRVHAAFQMQILPPLSKLVARKTLSLDPERQILCEATRGCWSAEIATELHLSARPERTTEMIFMTALGPECANPMPRNNRSGCREHQC